jgi:hypothetical protein
MLLCGGCAMIDWNHDFMTQDMEISYIPNLTPPSHE